MTKLRNQGPEPEYPSLGWRSLGLSWAILLGAVVAGGALLQTLGPPREGLAGRSGDRPVAQAAATGPASVRSAPNPTSDTAKPLSSDAIAALLAKVQAQITESPDGLPPGKDAVDMLTRVSAALPNGSPQDRERAKDLAADLFDRAKSALQAGKVDEEQHWLALGSILAPPPDLAPGEPATTARAQAGPPDAGARQDITPNEAEIEQPAPARNPPAGGGQPRDIASNTGADRSTQQPDGGSAPGPGVAESKSAEPATETATSETANSPEAPSTAGGPQQASGTSLSIHVLANAAPAQEEKLKELTARLRSNFDQTQMHTEADVPRVAVIQYATPADHSTAKDVGRVLGAMGYPWHIERLPADRSDAAPRTVEVWLPSGERFPQEFRPRRRMHFRQHGWLPGWLPLWF
jgi:hypothetical protein